MVDFVLQNMGQETVDPLFPGVAVLIEIFDLNFWIARHLGIDWLVIVAYDTAAAFPHWRFVAFGVGDFGIKIGSVERFEVWAIRGRTNHY